MWFVPPRRRHQLPSDHLAVGPLQVKSATSIRDLAVYLDSDLSMKSHITRFVCTCFGVLRQIRSIRRSLLRESVLTLISSLVMFKLDYCNVAFAGLPRCELDRLQTLKYFLANVNSCSCRRPSVRLSSVVCLSSVVYLSLLCNVRAPYSADKNFRQFFCAISYVVDLTTSR